MTTDQPDIYTRLLTTSDGCPACGIFLGPQVEVCPGCRRALMVVVKPAERSHGTVTLAGMWIIVALGALLFFVGVLVRPPEVATQANDQSIAIYVAIASLVLGIFAGMMTWACWTRRPFALYIGIGLIALVASVVIVIALLIRGMEGLILVVISILISGPMTMVHLSVFREFQGERRRPTFDSHASSAKGLYNEGRTFYSEGLHYLAAQRWARAIGKNPTEPAYPHALGLALARLGYYDDALRQLEQAMRMAPEDQQFRKSYAIVAQQAGRSTYERHS